MANATPVHKEEAPKKVSNAAAAKVAAAVAAPPSPIEDLALEDQIAALKAQLAAKDEALVAALESNNNAGHKSVIQNQETLPDGVTVKTDY